MSNEEHPVSQARGRGAQKARTRAAIIEAAQRLPRPTTVERAADAAGVSRATAYRYFPTQESLLVELGSADYWRDAEVAVTNLRSPSAKSRLNRVIEAVVDTVRADELHVRTALRVYHDTWLRDPEAPVRRGRRKEWIEKIVEPLPEPVRARLRPALTLVVGPDQVIMLKDVAGLDAAETRRILKWIGEAVLEKALREMPTAGGPEAAETSGSAASARGQRP